MRVKAPIHRGNGDFKSPVTGKVERCCKPVVMSPHTMRLRLNPTGKDCDTAQNKEQWQAMAAPHVHCDPGWVSDEPMIDSPVADPRRGAHPMPSAADRKTMARRERGRDLVKAGYTLMIPSNASMRVASRLFFQRLVERMQHAAAPGLTAGDGRKVRQLQQSHEAMARLLSARNQVDSRMSRQRTLEV